MGWDGNGPGIVGQPFFGSLKLLAAAVRGASLGTKLCGAELGSGAAGGSLLWEVSECLISCCYRLLQATGMYYRQHINFGCIVVSGKPAMIYIL